MSPGADLFVVCKQCGSEVSPYITECPYCGNRLRRRAPKLPRANGPGGPRGSRPGLGSLLRRAGPGAGVGRGGRAGTRTRPAPAFSDRWAVTRPYATIVLVAAAFGCWVATRAEPSLFGHMVIFESLHGDWWRLFTFQFAYEEGGGGGVYAFVAITCTGLFGWLAERRHGPAVVLALFLGAGVAGGLVAEAVYTTPVLVGANAGALALLGAWVVPDLQAMRAGGYYDGDLLGAATIGALLLAIPFAREEASWLAGLTGGALGLAVGLGLTAIARAET